MDPTTIFCPNTRCHARGQTGRGNIGIHSQKEQRFIGRECHQTFSARKGTVFYRLRTSAETVVRACSHISGRHVRREACRS
jgi:transposase-like protein